MSSFRPMRRAQQSLSADEIREVLRTARRGVLSVTGDDGWPYGVRSGTHHRQARPRDVTGDPANERQET